jgi:hypothetical protein
MAQLRLAYTASSSSSSSSSSWAYWINALSHEDMGEWRCSSTIRDLGTLRRWVISKIWGFHGCDCEECRLLGYRNLVRTSQEAHYVSVPESSRLKLCKNWGFHGGDYEECRLLGYKNLVLTSQKTHYVSATQSSQLMLCKIWGVHGSDYEECRLLWGRVAPVRTDVSEELSSSITKVTIIGELGTTLAVTCNRRKLWRNTMCFSAMSRRAVS